MQFEKPQNYPHGFTKGEDAMKKVEKYETAFRYKSPNQEKKVTERMNRHNSQENIMSSSLKRKLSKKSFHKSPLLHSHERSGSTSQKRFNFTNFTQEVGMLDSLIFIERKSGEKPKKMKKEKFDKIYRRFMNDKMSLEIRLEEKRRNQKLREEYKIQELQKSRNR